MEHDRAATDGYDHTNTINPMEVVRIAIDADCPACGKPERSYDPASGIFACSSLGGGPCGYESTDRTA